MTKNELAARTDAAFGQTHDALATVYTALPPGQQKTVLKKPEVKAVLVRFHVIESDGSTPDTMTSVDKLRAVANGIPPSAWERLSASVTALLEPYRD